MIPPVNIRFENLPDIRTDYTEQFADVAEYLEDKTLERMAAGGDPAWERTKFGAIPRLYDRFAGTVERESDEKSAEVSVGKGMPDVFAHHFGAEFDQRVTPKQRSFFWYKFSETDDEMWRAMALSSTIHIKIPKRELVAFHDEDLEFIIDTLGHSILTFRETNANA